MFTAGYWINLLLSLPGIIVAITFHEIAHGLAAESMGDHTAQMQGRLSFNPLRHLDPIGFLSMIFLHFGWARPVPVNPNNFRNRRKGVILVALSGCLTNLLFGFLAMAAYYAVVPIGNDYLDLVMYYMMTYNVMFGIFNLIPIPPLDGSQILAEFLPYNARIKYESFARYGMWVLLACIWLGLFGYVITPLVNGVLDLYSAILVPLFSLIYG